MSEACRRDEREPAGRPTRGRSTTCPRSSRCRRGGSSTAASSGDAVHGDRRHGRRAARPPRGRGSGRRGAPDRRLRESTSGRPRPSRRNGMAVAQETLDQLRTAGLEEIDPEIAGCSAARLERQRGQIELIASENFTWPSVLEAVGSVPTNKYAEGYPGGATTAAARSSTRSRSSRSTARRSSSAPTTQTCSRTPARRRTWPRTSPCSARRHDPPLDLDHGGHLTHGLKVNFSGALPDRPLRRLARDRDGRLRRGAQRSRASTGRS